MKDEIEQWKRENGNSVNYTTKELIQALHIKIDKSIDRFDRRIELMASKKMVIGMWTFAIMLISALAGYIFYG